MIRTYLWVLLLVLAVSTGCGAAIVIEDAFCRGGQVFLHWADSYMRRLWREACCGHLCSGDRYLFRNAISRRPIWSQGARRPRHHLVLATNKSKSSVFAELFNLTKYSLFQFLSWAVNVSVEAQGKMMTTQRFTGLHRLLLYNHLHITRN